MLLIMSFFHFKLQCGIELQYLFPNNFWKFKKYYGEVNQNKGDEFG